MATSFNSPTYPYERVQIGYNRFKGAEYIPYKLLMYLLDLPDKNGYEPVDDNNRPRVRLAKYLWYDGARPLSQALPTPAQKLSLLFDGEEPVLETDEQKAKHPKGYRLFWQVFWGQSQTEAKTLLKCYLGRVLPVDENIAKIGVVFEILSNVNLESNTRTDAYERSYAIEQCIIEALSGVNIAGIGVVDFARMSHTDNGSRPIADSGTVVGRELHVSLTWAENSDALIVGDEEYYDDGGGSGPDPGPGYLLGVIYDDTTEHWADLPGFLPSKGAIIIYSDYAIVDGKAVPAVKIGDGSTYLADLPFVSDDIRQTLQEHIDNTQIHVTASEKDLWNNKVSCGVELISPADNDYVLIFSTSEG